MPNSLEDISNPLSKSKTSLFVYCSGNPMDSRDVYIGLMPFAEKSLTQDTMLFLATCQGLIPGGTSVLSTSMSHLKTSFTPFFRLLSIVMIATSSVPTRVAEKYRLLMRSVV